MMVIVIMMWVMKIVMIKVMMLMNHFLMCPDLEAIGEKPIVEKSVGYHKLDCHDHLGFIKCLISLFQ